MISEIIDFCLNNLNGTFCHTPEYICKAPQTPPLVFSIMALYLAFIGHNTFKVSYLLANVFLLYRILSFLEEYLLDQINTYFSHSHLLRIALRVPSHPLSIAFASGLFLFYSQQLKFRQTLCLFGRVAHSVVSTITAFIIHLPPEKFMFLNFFIVKIVVHAFADLYFIYPEYFGIILFSFIGTYYFLQTIHSFKGISAPVFMFFPSSKAMMVSALRMLILSYITFAICMSFAVFSQIMIREKIKNKVFKPISNY